MTDFSVAASRIAVVGMACRLPGANSVGQFWRNLCAGVESIRPLSREEMLDAGLTLEELDDPHHVPFGALVDGPDLFDAAFFGMTTREAELMDPQQRLFLLCAWEAFEHAGYDPGRVGQTVAVFGGANFNSYLTKNLIPADVFEDKAATLQAILVNDKDYLATRVAYKLNLRGPACTVQSGCSTSLVAVHLATQSLLNYQCDVALAGGVAVDVARAQGYWSHEGSVFSPDGHCRVFDAQARGTVFGNGVGCVVLKRLDEAVRDGDTVYAALLGSALNNDGSAKVGFTAPSVTGQSEVIAEALADAGVPPESIGYIETHGTGTQLGDPIEIEALTKVFGIRPPGFARCAIGSVKTNVGHLDSAAGVTSLIKTVLALRHRALPPSLHFAEPNPKIAFGRTSFFVNTGLTEWSAGTRAGLPRRAGVSSFGMGGTNAHVVLEEGSEPPSEPTSRSHELLVWSARSRAALDAATANLISYLRSDSREALRDIAFTLQTGRAAFDHRRMVVCRDAREGASILEHSASGARTGERNGELRAVAFLFPAQTAAYPGMAIDLYRAESVFHDEIDACREELLTDTGIDLAKTLATQQPTGTDDRGVSVCTEARMSRLALFAVEYALARLWQSWGVIPAAVVGHGSGQHAAACVAGILSRRDALRVLADNDYLEHVHLSPPTIPLVSSSTGHEIEMNQAVDRQYWALQFRAPVQTANALEYFAARGPFHFVEVGPRRARVAGVVESGLPAGCVAVSSLPASNEDCPGDQSMLEALGELWLAGTAVNWSGVHAGKRRRRVPLPTYPFEGARYWVDPPPEEESDATNKASRFQKLPDPAQWLYVPTWQRTAAVELLTPAVADAAAFDWFVLADDTPLTQRLVERLRRVPGARVVVVRRGTRYERSDAGHITIDPLNADHYKRLQSEQSTGTDLVVVHMWTLASSGRADTSREVIAAQDAGFYSVLRLARALAAADRSRRTSLRVVTANGHDVFGTEPLSIACAPMFAAARVLPQEQPAVDCACIDIDEDSKIDWGRVDFLAERIVAELMSFRPEPFIAYRGTTRWVQRYEPLSIVRRGTGADLRPRGTYLILGGLGRIGLTLAEHFARTSKANIVLIARTPFPPRELWDDWLIRGNENDLVTHRIRRLAALEELGASVLVLAADIGSPDEMTRALAMAEQRFGRVDGVIATAGIVDAAAFQPMTDLTPAECERQFRPKVEGLYALERALGDRTLDFCMIVSSLSSVLGGLGYAAYAAANIFMDAFVRRHNRSHDTKWLSVNWDAWRWRDVVEDAPGAALSRLALTPQEACGVFEKLVGASAADQVVVSTNSLHERLDQWVERVGARADATMATPHAQKPASDDDQMLADADKPAREPLTPTQRVVVDVWRQVLGLERVALNDTFLDLGGNSLAAVQAISALEQALGTHVAIEEFIFQTAAQLATLCDRKLAMRSKPPAEAAAKGGFLGTLRNALARS